MSEFTEPTDKASDTVTFVSYKLTDPDTSGMAWITSITVKLANHSGSTNPQYHNDLFVLEIDNGLELHFSEPAPPSLPSLLFKLGVDFHEQLDGRPTPLSKTPIVTVDGISISTRPYTSTPGAPLEIKICAEPNSPTVTQIKCLDPRIKVIPPNIGA